MSAEGTSGPARQGALRVREMLIDELRADIVGPRGGPEEVLPTSESPLRGYLSGVLFPQRSPHDEDAGDLWTGARAGGSGDSSDDDASGAGDAGTGGDPAADAGGASASVPNPSSFGLTCTVSPGTEKIAATVDYGTYAATGGQGTDIRFRRTPHTERLVVDLGGGGSGSIPLSDRPDLVLRHTAGPSRGGGGGTTLRIFLVNTRVHRGAQLPAVSSCAFQPSITLSAHDGASRVFVAGRPAQRSGGLDDPDLALFELLFRDKAHIATGHCCAVEWDEAEASAHGGVRSLATTFVPRYDMQHIGPRTSDARYLDMEALAGAGMAEYRDLLSPLADDYEAWIRDSLESRIGSLPDEHRAAAERQAAECRTALGRIRAGIRIVSTDRHAADAFAFANGAMRLQMLHSRWAEQAQKAGKPAGYEPPPPESPPRWHLFQLAFFLLNVESIARPESPDRSVADLLWFPTGGGKTEAYLGLIAFTIAHRRIRRSETGHRYGTAVIMRYTLRLLTLQQFHRAAALVCACEVLRRGDEAKWGDEPFLVGLWVGYAATPNTLKAAEEALASARAGRRPREQNPMQIISCPWCGARIGARDYSVSGMPYQCRVFCPRPSCDFAKRPGRDGQGIPVLVVDEDIYRRCPSLVIGTVDKFAQVTWKGRAGALFGMVDKYCEKHGFTRSSLDPGECGRHRDARSFLLAESGPPRLDPPELIIQDELHLISGPLGTLTGIYETAVDALCAGPGAGIAPKIVASTATAKQASTQIRSLFDRAESRVFPPQGLEFGESFFARRVPPSERPGRVYVGVCVTSRSGPITLGRISAAILRKARSLEEGAAGGGGPALADIDPYHTLVSYFNTIRDLGGANKMYDDTVPRLIQRIYSNFELAGAEGGGGGGPRGKDDYKDALLEKKELTSRIDSADIPGILRDLEARIGGGTDGARAVDLLLCTNMLSVGVDIQRLGAMIVNGQPKNHSEYIQATGRIGRASPGLIVANLNFFKPRDLSHYEDFCHYHSILHKNVEPITVTPFSPRSRDRALLGVLVAMVRHSDPRLAPEAGASRLDAGAGYVGDILERVRAAVASRVGRIDATEAEGTAADLDEHIRFWHDAATGASGGGLALEYSRPRGLKARKKENVAYLLRSTGEDESLGLGEAPNSLRDAEVPVKVWYASDMRIERGGGGGRR